MDALEGGAPIEAVARICGTTEIGLTIAGIQWLAQHPDEVTNEEHRRICTVLACAMGNVPPLGQR